MLKHLVMLAFLSACWPHPAKPANVAMESADMLWCVATILKTGDAIVACSPAEEMCNHLREMALSNGGRVGIRDVGECNWVELTP